MVKDIGITGLQSKSNISASNIVFEPTSFDSNWSIDCALSTMVPYRRVPTKISTNVNDEYEINDYCVMVISRRGAAR